MFYFADNVQDSSINKSSKKIQQTSKICQILFRKRIIYLIQRKAIRHQKHSNLQLNWILFSVIFSHKVNLFKEKFLLIFASNHIPVQIVWGKNSNRISNHSKDTDRFEWNFCCIKFTTLLFCRRRSRYCL